MPKKKTRVAFCLRDMQIGGVESVAIRTFEQLINRDDLDISFVSYVKITEPVYAQWFANHPQVKQYVLYPCPWLGTKLKRFFLLRIGQHLMRDLYRWGRRVFFRHKILSDVDVVVDYYDFGFVSELKRVKVKKIAWWHSSITKFLSKNYVKNLRHYDLFVTLTDGFVDEFKECWPEYAHKVARLYNPVDVDGIRNRANVAEPVDMGDYFVSVARLSADKDIETVLRAFDKFWTINNQPDVKMVFVGGGDIEKYRTIANGYGAAKNIEFVGAQPNPFGFMRGAMAHILSSHSEGLPTVLIEAMATGTLNISSNCKNGPREILLDGDAGLLFQPGNAEQLAQHMTDVWRGVVPVKKMIDVATKSLPRFESVLIAPEVVERLKQ
ncbi:MAG: glycosyltransferase [Alphaproteobacteria bacterium]|nr:glycosyltransferase [Alphaproteobacteria bacterium]